MWLYMKKVKILTSGVALPKQTIYSEKIDENQQLSKGMTEQYSGVTSRFYATTESATDLAITAIHNALENSPCSLQDVDCLISASGTMEQAIPYNAAKIHARLNLSHPIPAFDVNMTCLSALMAMDLASSMLHCGQYKTILIVSSEIASVGVNWSDKETAGLFGDGAAALLISTSEETHQGIIASHFATYSEGVEYCQIRGGGSLHHPTKITGDYTRYGMFEMQGKEVFRLTAKVIDDFLATLFKKAGCLLSDIDWIVPHQASALALAHIQKRLAIPDEKIINILPTRGNQIAASIPSALHELLTREPKAKSGDKILLIGTSAGLSIGAMVLTI